MLAKRTGSILKIYPTFSSVNGKWWIKEEWGWNNRGVNSIGWMDGSVFQPDRDCVRKQCSVEWKNENFYLDVKILPISCLLSWL